MNVGRFFAGRYTVCMAEVTAEKQSVSESTRWRRWRFATWLLLVVCVPVTIAWLGSVWISVTWVQFARFGVIEATQQACLNAGQLSYWRQEPHVGSNVGAHGQWLVERNSATLGWRPFYLNTGEYVVLSVPLWFPAVVLAASTVVVWRRERMHAGRCAAIDCDRCGYDRRGLLDGAACPECGAGAPVAAKRGV